MSSASASHPASKRVAWFLLLLLALGLGCFWFFRSIALPVGLSLFFGYLLLPVVDRLERRRLDRSWGALIVVSGVVVVLAFATIEVVPYVYNQVATLVLRIPTAARFLMQEYFPLLRSRILELGLYDAEAFDDLIANLHLGASMLDPLKTWFLYLGTSAGNVLGGVVNMALVPVVTFFLLRDGHAWQRSAAALIPIDVRPGMRDIGQRLDMTMRALLKGQLIVAATLGVIYVSGLSLVGIDAAVAIGVVAGICRLVPYLDVVVGGFLSAVVLLSNLAGLGQVAGVAAVFVLAQTFDGMWLTPRVIGERVGLHPLVVILSVVAFASRLGFYGVLLAVPIVASAKVVWECLVPTYLASRWFRGVAVAVKPTSDRPIP